MPTIALYAYRVVFDDRIKLGSLNPDYLHFVVRRTIHKRALNVEVDSEGLFCLVCFHRPIVVLEDPVLTRFLIAIRDGCQ